MATTSDPQVSALRRFNRFYTRQIGLLSDRYLASPFSLAEVRILFELAHRNETTASQLAGELQLDRGYLSRVLQTFRSRRLIDRKTSAADARRSLLTLTQKGRKAFAPLDDGANQHAAAMLEALPVADRQRLIAAMNAIETLLAPREAQPVPYLLRPPGPGDMGWVIQRHGVLYAQEYGWDDEFEALVAGIVAQYMKRHDPKRERCWMAERNGENVGCIFCVQKSAKTAQLRLLLVDPSARGLGLGARLVDECMRFARAAGYRKMILWTNSLLHAARHIYENLGFRLVREERHHSFGHDLVGQFWEVRL